MATPEGWYPDANEGNERYWDGENWTEQRRPAAAVPTATPPHVDGLGVVAIVLAVLVAPVGLVLGVVSFARSRRMNTKRSILPVVAILVGGVLNSSTR